MVSVQIGIINYLYRGAPYITMEEMIIIVQSMKPIKT